MKKVNKVNLVIFAIIGLVIFCGRVVFAAGEYHIVKDRSTLAFEIMNSDGEAILGEFLEFDGNIFLDKHNLETFNTNIDVQAINIKTDSIEKDDQMRGEEYFDAVNFPTISFTSRRILRKKIDVSRKHPNYEVLGSLNIKGQKVEIAFPVFVSGPITQPMGGESIYITGEKNKV
ncbi:MAG: YceI family protein [Candidatus Omnitrophica bacterium]|nr:YceI family protein [Candidatus Omnitrophota bacterium]